jgi:hypothetical protein
MMWLKGCPKCHGDLMTDEDEFSTFVKCLQCGRTLSSLEEDHLKAVGSGARTLCPQDRVLALPESGRAA